MFSIIDIQRSFNSSHLHFKLSLGLNKLCHLYLLKKKNLKEIIIILLQYLWIKIKINCEKNLNISQTEK